MNAEERLRDFAAHLLVLHERRPLDMAQLIVEQVAQSDDAIERHLERSTRSQLRRLALQRGEPVPDFSAPPPPHTPEWNRALRRETAAQKALIERMDFPRNHDLRNTGIMGQIRAERLELLEQLLAYEPEDKRGPLPDENHGG